MRAHMLCEQNHDILIIISYACCLKYIFESMDDVSVSIVPEKKPKAMPPNKQDF